jgi:hypothetical protein
VRRNPVPPLVFLAGVLAVALGAWFFATYEAGRYAATSRVAASPSEIRMSLTINRKAGPIASEEYRMDDQSGLSTSQYRAINRKGLTIRVDVLPREATDVPFLFDKLVSDGIWELRTKPPRGDTATSYTVDIYQLTNGKHGSHEFSFTDPHYWATTGGHQYTIHLDRNKPVPNLLQMSSTVLVEPRYEKIVDAFLDYGSEAFRSKVAAAQSKLRSGT